MQPKHYTYNTTSYIERSGTFGSRVGDTRINTCLVIFLRNATFVARRNKIPPRRGCQAVTSQEKSG